MRRLPPAVWILLPLALGGIYAGLHPLLAPRPTLENVVPADAVLTIRYRNLETLNRLWFRSQASPAPADALGPSRNLPGLAGVDTTRPFHLVYLPRAARHEPTMMIFPVADEAALRGRFLDPDYFVTKGHIRHAQYLDVRGGFAAIGGDRGAVRRLGEGGITARDLGEDVALAAHVPGLVEYALLKPAESPWREALEALGVDPAAAREVPLEDGSGGTALEVPGGRTHRLVLAWDTLRLWCFGEARRVVLELRAKPGPLRDALAEVARGADDVERFDVPPPLRAQAWIVIPSGLERMALAHALWAAGVAFPGQDGERGPGDDVAFVGREGGLLLWTEPSPGTGYAWTLGLAAPRGTLPDLSGFLPAGALASAPFELAEGALPLTVADTGGASPSPAATLIGTTARDLDAIFLGAAAEEARARFETGQPARAPGPRVEAPEATWLLIARFGLIEARARTLLEGQLEPGGLLAALAGGDLEGALFTDGARLRLEVAAVPRGP